MDVFCLLSVSLLKNSKKLTETHLCWSLFSDSPFCFLWENMVEMDPLINFRGPLYILNQKRDLLLINLLF